MFELCGVNHGFMPINVVAILLANTTKKKGKGVIYWESLKKEDQKEINTLFQKVDALQGVFDSVSSKHGPYFKLVNSCFKRLLGLLRWIVMLKKTE